MIIDAYRHRPAKHRFARGARRAGVYLRGECYGALWPNHLNRRVFCSQRGSPGSDAPKRFESAFLPSPPGKSFQFAKVKTTPRVLHAWGFLMISFGDGWEWEDGRVHHACGPDVSTHWSGERTCVCGAGVPRHARSFQRWVKREAKRAAADGGLEALFSTDARSVEDPPI